jgi:hypothetical protein
VGLKLSGTHQLLVCNDDVNRLGDYMDTMKKNMETFIYANRESDLEVITGETKHMKLPRQKNWGQNHDIKIAWRSLEMWHTSNI